MRGPTLTPGLRGVLLLVLTTTEMGWGPCSATFQKDLRPAHKIMVSSSEARLHSADMSRTSA